MKTIKDERLELENLRIKSSAVDLLTMVLTLTLITDFFIHASLATMIDKIILVCILWGYIFIYSLTKRNIISFSNLTNKQLITTATLVTTLLSTIMMSAKNYIEYADKYDGIFDPLFLSIVMIFFIQFLVIAGISFYFYFKKMEKEENAYLD